MWAILDMAALSCCAAAQFNGTHCCRRVLELRSLYIFAFSVIVIFYFCFHFYFYSNFLLCSLIFLRSFFFFFFCLLVYAVNARRFRVAFHAFHAFPLLNFPFLPRFAPDISSFSFEILRLL